METVAMFKSSTSVATSLASSVSIRTIVPLPMSSRPFCIARRNIDMKTRSMISAKLRRFIRHDKGAAMAELAILVPFLILLVAAISEFGRYFQQYTALAKSTRAAARYLSNHSYSTSQDEATNLAVCGQLNCAGVPPLAENLSAANICIESTQATGTTRI